MTPHLALFFLVRCIIGSQTPERIKKSKSLPLKELNHLALTQSGEQSTIYWILWGVFSQEIERLARCESQLNRLQLGCLTKSYLTAHVVSRNSDYYVLVFGKRHAVYLDIKVEMHFKNPPRIGRASRLNPCAPSFRRWCFPAGFNYLHYLRQMPFFFFKEYCCIFFDDNTSVVLMFWLCICCVVFVCVRRIKWWWRYFLCLTNEPTFSHKCLSVAVMLEFFFAFFGFLAGGNCYSDALL